MWNFQGTIMNSRLTKIPAFALVFAIVSLAANATPTLGPNGHYYEVIAGDGISWDAANAAATGTIYLGATGHLATLTTATEDAFVDGLRQAALTGAVPIITQGQVWIGGFQADGSAEPGDGWGWVNGEGSFPGTNGGSTYANWADRQGRAQQLRWPNINERHLALGRYTDDDGWNDEGSAPGSIGGFIVEYSDYVTDADDDAAAADSGETITIDVLVNDEVDTGVASVTIDTAPASGGTAVVNGNFTIEYKSGAGFGGMDTFVYRVTANNGLTDTATVTVDVSTTVSVVIPGLDQLFFNQANVPGSDNPLTAAYQEVLAPGEVSVDCCRVLDTREGAGPAKHGYFLRKNLDLGLAIANTSLNPSCVGMPTVAAGTAILAPWQRGIPTSRGIDDLGNSLVARENDLGVCFIQSDIVSKGVVFSEEDARNVLGYEIDCSEPDISFRPFTGGVAIDPNEIDAPFVTSWTAECDESRSAKKYSDNLMALNLRHDRGILSSKLYVSGMATLTFASIVGVKLEGCVDNSTGFLNKLLDLTARAGADILKAKGEAAVLKLDDATRLALLIGPNAPVTDPYGEGLAACPGNPQGLIVGRLMASKFAACSEIAQAGAGEISQSPAFCAIAGDILNALPPLPTL